MQCVHGLEWNSMIKKICCIVYEDRNKHSDSISVSCMPLQITIMHCFSIGIILIDASEMNIIQFR